jgi:hypothetical protein
MKPIENPPRLLSHPEFGRDWRAAADDAIPSERLASCGQAVAVKVAALQAAPAGVGTGTGVAIKTSVIVKIGLPILAVGGTVAAYAVLHDSAPPFKPQQPAVTRPANPIDETASAIAPTPPSALSGEAIHAPKRQTKVAEPPTLAVENTASESSLLPEQLGLFNEAKQLAGRGDFDGALLVLAQIEERYPQSPISPEARLARAEYLVRAERHGEATQEIQKLILDPALVGKKATLFQMLGDSWMKRGRCDRAVAAFKNALASGLSDDQAVIVQSAIKKCGDR